MIPRLLWHGFLSRGRGGSKTQDSVGVGKPGSTARTTPCSPSKKSRQGRSVFPHQNRRWLNGLIRPRVGNPCHVKSAPVVARLSKPWTRGYKYTRRHWCGKARFHSANSSLLVGKKASARQVGFPTPKPALGERLDPSTGWKTRATSKARLLWHGFLSRGRGGTKAQDGRGVGKPGFTARTTPCLPGERTRQGRSVFPHQNRRWVNGLIRPRVGNPCHVKIAWNPAQSFRLSPLPGGGLRRALHDGTGRSRRLNRGHQVRRANRFERYWLRSAAKPPVSRRRPSALPGRPGRC